MFNLYGARFQTASWVGLILAFSPLSLAHGSQGAIITAVQHPNLHPSSVFFLTNCVTCAQRLTITYTGNQVHAVRAYGAMCIGSPAGTPCVRMPTCLSAVPLQLRKHAM